MLVAPSGTPQDNLILLSKAYVFITSFPYLIVTIVVFNTSLKHIKPDLRYFKWDAARKIMGMGGLFFVCQILYMVIANTNEYFITSFTTPENTVDYTIYNKLFMLAGMIVTLALSPVWSMVTKAIAEKEYEWLRKLYKKAQQMSLLVIAADLCLIAVLQFVINLWLGDAAIKVNYWYAIIFAVWGSVFVYQGVLSTFACGTGKMKLQAICYGIGVIFKIAFLLVTFHYTSSWIIVIASNIIIILPYCLLQRRALNKYFYALGRDRINV